MLSIVLSSGIVRADERQLDCLTKTVYFEAGNQPKIGKLAVAYVTMNRVFSNGWPSTVCDVVYQKSQYGWTRLKKPIHKDFIWNVSRRVALGVYKEYNTHNDPTNGATYYCRLTEHFPWLHRIKSKVKIGQHNFYRVSN
jgi:N-acetylmuramoyl-L-alanine amidase